MQLTAATHAKVVFQLLLHPGTEHLPWQQRAEIVRGGGIRTERRRSDEGCSFGPVLAPVMGAVCAQAGRDGLSVNHSTYRIREVDVKSKKCKPEKTQGKVYSSLVTKRFTTAYLILGGFNLMTDRQESPVHIWKVKNLKFCCSDCGRYVKAHATQIRL